jgi:hypothetical protein
MRVTAEARDAAVSWSERAAADDANVTAWHAWLAAEAAVIAAEAHPFAEAMAAAELAAGLS